MKNSKLYKIFDYLKNLKTSRLLLSMMHNGYLIETGWLQNFNRKDPVDIKKNPIPWTTYSFIRFINEYLKPSMEIFEFGAGNSTIYYSERVNHVYTVEHDLAWFNKIKDQLPENSTIYFQELNSEYEKCINKPGKSFDIIIIDGRRRNNCIYEAVHYIKEDGLIILDDSERENYKEGINFLLKKGYKKIDFWGISHRYFHDKATTIFFKHL
jgi:hypothetical protein